MLAKAQNVSAIADTKTTKGAGKHHGAGVAAVPVELFDFGQLLEDSALLLEEGTGGLPLLKGAPPVDEDKPAELATLEVGIQSDVVLAAGASPAVSLLRAWQGWLEGASGSSGTPEKGTGSAEEGISGAADLVSGRETAAARAKDDRAALEALGQRDDRGTEPQISQQLSQSGEVVGKAAGSKSEGSVLTERESKGSVDAPHSLSGVAHTEMRKSNTAAPQIAVAHIDIPLRAPEWSSAFSEQVVMLAHDGGARAELRLNPAELGPIDVSLKVQDDRVHAAFTIHHAATADAVQAALPKLEQMLAERGVQLDSVSVDSAEGGTQRDAHNPNGGNGEGGRRPRGGAAHDEGAVRRVLVRNGLVDTFA